MTEQRCAIAGLAAHVGLMMWLLTPVHAAQTPVTLDIRPNRVGLNQQLTLTITVTNGSSNAVEQPSLPALEGFRVVAGPSVSTQFQWINGRSSSSKSFSYVLLPTQTGRFTVGPVNVRVGDDNISTNSVDVTVDEESSTPAPAVQQRMRRFPSIWDEPQVTTQDIAEQVFVTAEPDRFQAYPGQQITLTYKVYTQLSISGLELKESPALKGFWVEDIEVPRSPSPQIERVRGREFSVFVVKKQALFATAPGTFEIPASTFALGVRVRSNDPFSFFNFGTTEPVYRRTPPSEITILPFPKNGRPVSFGNLVGRFSIRSSADKTDVETGEAVALKVTLTGTGNLNTAGDVQLPKMPDFQIFSSKSSVKNTVYGDLIEGTKTWEYVIVPQTPGTHTIPPISLAYFDPANGRYEAVSSDPVNIVVTRSATDSGPAQRVASASQVKLTRQGSDVNFIKLAAGSIVDQSRPWFSGPILYVVLLLPVVANVCVFVFQRQAERLASNVTLLRQRRASRQAAQKLKEASRYLRDKRWTEFHGSLATAFSSFIGDRFGLPVIDLTRDQVGEKLAEIGLPEDLVSETVRLLDRCDFARFAPSQVSEKDSQDMIEKVRSLITRLERAAPSPK